MPLRQACVHLVITPDHLTIIKHLHAASNWTPVVCPRVDKASQIAVDV